MKERRIRGRLLPLLCCLPMVTGAAGLPAGSDEYNMPEAVSAVPSGSLEPTLMERAATADELAVFRAQHPQDGFWLFGERRDRPVRRDIVPGVWFREGKQALGKFVGKAQPGEYYVFQVVILGGPKVPCGTITVTVPAFVDSLSLGGIGPDGKAFSKALPWPKNGTVKPLWFGVRVPKEAKGTLDFALTVGGKLFPVSLKVDGPVLKDGGIHDAHRLARLQWLNSSIGRSETEVTYPFSPVQVHEETRTLSILGRAVQLGETGLPVSYKSFFSRSNTKLLPIGSEAFVKAPELTVDGRIWKPQHFAFTKQTPVGADWTATSLSDDGALTLTVNGRMEFDGFVGLKMDVRANRDVTYDKANFTFTLTPKASEYAMGLGMQGGRMRPALDWKWNPKLHQDAFWVGTINQGMMLRLKGSNFRRPLINAYYDFRPILLPDSWGSGGVSLRKTATSATVSCYSGQTVLKPGEHRMYGVDWYLTPFKTIDVAKHFATRYWHNRQQSKDDYQKIRSEGHTVVNVHHNRECNPFINYPYGPASIAAVKASVKDAHAHGLKLKLYYTTREVTQNMPEFMALYSMDGEIMVPRRLGVGWPVTNRRGPHPWLTAHVSQANDFVPAWHENIRYPQYHNALDLAVITTPDTRWNNFYLEGLNYLVKETDFDGIYIDDTALNRDAMQRARRILDQDGPNRRLVDMHSWNHYNPLARWANSDICFMELYPYYDSLWHGEGAFYMNRSPDYILTEMSGLCYGLMSEQLMAGNLRRGMVFGMAIRRPWSGDSRPAWKIWDAFGVIPGTEMIGWWDEACPVKTDRDDVLATVYRRPDGKVMLAVASFAGPKGPTQVTAHLKVDWKALGVNPAQVCWYAMPSGGFQAEKTFLPGEPLTMDRLGGWLLLLQPRR